MFVSALFLYPFVSLGIATDIESTSSVYIAGVLQSKVECLEGQRLVSENQFIAAQSPLHECLTEIYGESETDYINAIDLVYDWIDLQCQLEQYDSCIGISEQLYIWHQETFGQSHPDSLNALKQHGLVFRTMGDADSARETFKNYVELHVETFGANDPSTLESQRVLGGYYFELGQLEEAIDIYTQVAESYTKIASRHDPRTVATLCDLAKVLETSEQYSSAESLYVDIIDIYERYPNTDFSDKTIAKHNLAAVYFQQEKYSDAERLFLQVLEKRSFETDPSGMLISMNGLANVYFRMGRFEDAEKQLTLALEKSKEFQGVDHIDTATCLNDLANFYNNRIQYAKAEELILEEVEILEKIYGPEHPSTLDVYTFLVNVQIQQLKYDSAEQIVLEVLEIRKKTLGPNHPKTLSSFHNLAFVLSLKGDLTQAEIVYKAVLKIYPKATEADLLGYYTMLENMATLYTKQGRLDKAEAIFVEVLNGRIKLLGENHYDVLLSISSLAGVYQQQLRLDEAEKLLLLLIEKNKETLDEARTPLILYGMINLASLYAQERRFGEAKKLYLEAIKLCETTEFIGESHNTTLIAKKNLAGVYFSQGLAILSEKMYKEALEEEIKVFGYNHSQTLVTIQCLALVYQWQGKYDKTAEMLDLLMRLNEENLNRNLYGSNQDRQDYLSTFTNAIHQTQSAYFEVSLIPNTKNQQRLVEAMAGYGGFMEARSRNVDHGFRKMNEFLQASLRIPFSLRRVAFETNIKTKGLAFDTELFNSSTVETRLHPEDLILFNELKQLRLDESTLLQLASDLRSTDHLEQIANVSERILELESQLSLRNQQFRNQIPMPDLKDMKTSLPEGSILVDYVFYTDSSLDKKLNLGVYSLDSSGKLTGKKVANWEKLQELVAVFRETRSSALGKILYREFIEYVLPDLEAYDHVFISPDGILNLIPFELLQDKHGELLLDKINVSYLSTGRDLIRLQNIQSTDLSEPFVLANPTYSSKDNQVSLPATQKEAYFLKLLYPKATVITEEQATVEALRTVDSPKYLHIATHGFFDDDNPDTVLDNNPMTRSGLILAGSDDDKGVTRMLASEAVTLDLDGTELVVLSACESGLGKAENGEGVYGLRRAFALAGARSQVVSLWSVDDDATAYFMESFYTKLKEGKGKAEAMKETKLEMRSIEQWENPKYWAAFVLTGDWR